MKRTIKKQFWLSRDEAQDLQKKAKKTCLSEAALVRLLLRGYEPKEKPDDRFRKALRGTDACRRGAVATVGDERGRH